MFLVHFLVLYYTDETAVKVAVSINFLCTSLPLPVFVVQSADVIKLGYLFQVLRQFIELSVLLSVEVGLHERSDLTHIYTQGKFGQKYIDNSDN